MDKVLLDRGDSRLVQPPCIVQEPLFQFVQGWEGTFLDVVCDVAEALVGIVETQGCLCCLVELVEISSGQPTDDVCDDRVGQVPVVVETAGLLEGVDNLFVYQILGEADAREGLRDPGGGLSNRLPVCLGDVDEDAVAVEDDGVDGGQLSHSVLPHVGWIVYGAKLDIALHSKASFKDTRNLSSFFRGARVTRRQPLLTPGTGPIFLTMIPRSRSSP